MTAVPATSCPLHAFKPMQTCSSLIGTDMISPLKLVCTDSVLVLLELVPLAFRLFRRRRWWWRRPYYSVSLGLGQHCGPLRLILLDNIRARHAPAGEDD